MKGVSSMNYSLNQIKKLKKLIKAHVDGNETEKIKAEKRMKKYGCNNTKEAFNLVRNFTRGIANEKI